MTPLYKPQNPNIRLY